jgi:hypothetical protein
MESRESPSRGGDDGPPRRSHNTLGSVPVQEGEFDESHERPLSAPPPPGFSDWDERSKRATESLLWSNEPVNSNNEQRSGTGLLGASLEASKTNAASERLSSGLSNLADVLGKGLADSMEDYSSAKDRESSNKMMALFQDDLSFHRQSRHAATRLVGSFEARNEVPSFNKGNQSATGMYDANSSSFFNLLGAPKTSPGEADGKRNKNSSFGQAKGIGMNVMEPENSHADDLFGGISGTVVSSQRLDTQPTQGAYQPHHQHRPLQQIDEFHSHDASSKHIWSPHAREFQPTVSQTPSRVSSGVSGLDDNFSVANSSVSDSAAATELTARQAEYELRPFLWDLDRNSPSRTLAILRVSWLHGPDIRSACEAHGAIESFRSEFSHLGVYFVSYYDIRSSQYAAVELEAVLQRMMLQKRSSEEVMVRYCLPLNASSQLDESQIVIANLPRHMDQAALMPVLNSYGAVRSVLYQPSGSFIVEFQNIQDSKQALLELESSQPWGYEATVEVGVRNPVERKRGRELLALLSRWRQAIPRTGGANTSFNAPPEKPSFSGVGAAAPWNGTAPTAGLNSIQIGGSISVGSSFSGGGVQQQQPSMQMGSTPQLVLGPDGRYQVVQIPQQMAGQQFVNPQQTAGQQQFTALQPLPNQQAQTQQIVQGPDGQLYLATVPLQNNNNTYLPQPTQLRPIQTSSFGNQSVGSGSFVQGGRVGTSTPYYAHVVTTDNTSVTSGRSSRSYGSMKEDGDNRHLMLDLEAVEHDLDSRTSLMVRNIPNKYTQKMLLNEFHDNGLGPGTIDFFYLPIDFKNRCNRGYAFINFVDYKDILTFHRQYFGKHWRTFNSDKICDITYARIQGKAAMLKRFENSALMEKDDEYKPLVFVSDGPNKGQRVPFPGPQATMRIPGSGGDD